MFHTVCVMPTLEITCNALTLYDERGVALMRERGSPRNDMDFADTLEELEYPLLAYAVRSLSKLGER